MPYFFKVDDDFHIFGDEEWRHHLQPIYNLVAANQTRLQSEELKIDPQEQLHKEQE